MVVQDIKGTCMQAEIPKFLVGNFSEVLKEFNMYTMTNFIVTDTKPRNRATTNPLILLFSQRTMTSDIIGVVVGREQARDITTKGGVKTKRMAITLQDLSMVDQITPHLDANRDEPLEVMDFKDTLQGESPSTGIRISQHPTQSGVSAVDELKKGDAIVRSIDAYAS
ncbi:hypothetical protein PIB30_082512 [Stylosanthes scabra]|uniref:Replication protein A 70 kDa DNA-binding subunit B/D first OB fold domain-containing protein n=1 Tax=Stylosanthes scabra TaxID=79078 RepID=A0ABU6YTW0_9FABA|nr:hypothetical protein [Stylosanthes scabra]